MAILAAAVPYIAAAGTIISTVGAIQQGNTAKTQANYQAAQMNQQAGQDRATAQRQGIAQRQQADIAGSRAIAIAGASGSGVTDPTVSNIVGDIGAQGEYNALSALYNGEERARGLESQAVATQYSGQQAQKAGYTKAAATILGSVTNPGMQSLIEKYSPTGVSFGSSGGYR